MTLVIKENLNSQFTASYQVYNRRTGSMGSPVGQGLYTGLKRYRDDDSVRTPGFKRLKRAQLPINFYSKHVEILSDPLSNWNADIDGYPVTSSSAQSTYYYTGNCQYHGVSIQSLGSADDPTQRAIANLLQKLGEGKAATLVTLAELDKTANHVAKTATRIYRALKALRRGEFGAFTSALGVSYTSRQRRRFNKRYDRAKSLDAQEHRYSWSISRTETQSSRIREFMAETWLEYRYGWRPLLKDVDDHARALAELSIERSNLVRWATGKAQTSKKFKSYDAAAGGGLDIQEKATYDRRFVQYGVGYRISNGTFSSYDQLGIGNPLEVAWEIIPFSFVADWFLPVGTFLSSLTATSGLVFVTGYKSIRNVSQTDFSFQGNGKTTVSGGTRYGPLRGGAKGQRFIMDQIRSKLTDFPTASFPGFRDPRDNKSGGLIQALSAIALLQSLFLK